MKNESEKTVLNPTVIKLGLISLFADIASEMLYPITPIFLTTVIGASMASVGFIEGFAEATASLLKTFAGMWSDQILKRKPFIIIGYLFSALSKPLIGFASTWPHVLFARSLDRIGKGLRTPPRDALLAEAVSEKKRGAAFGWHRAMDTMGAVIGPLLAILYLSLSNDLRIIFYWALVPGLISVGIAFLISDKKTHLPSANRQKIQFFEFRSLSPSFKSYLIAWTVFAMTNSSDAFLLMKAKSVGIPLIEVILLYCFYNLVYAWLSPYFGHLSDRIGRKPVLILGLLVFAAVYVGFSIATDRWHFWILFGVYGFYMSATDGVGKAFAVDLVDPKKKATGLGLFGTLTGVATLIASTVSGVLWDQFGSTISFLYGSLGAVLSVVLLLIFVRTDSKSSMLKFNQ